MPGDAPGTLVIDGNLTGNGTLVFGSGDGIYVAGNANITGGVIAYEFWNGSAPTGQTSYSALQTGGSLTVSGVSYSVAAWPLESIIISITARSIS